MNIKGQYGVGLIEVLVALLLLALGILGFIALQYRALEATSEATSRVQAMNIARDLAEKIRLNNTTASKYHYEQKIDSYNKCSSEFCNTDEKVIFDLSQTQSLAEDAGMSFAVIACPNTKNDQQCIYVAWDKTMPKNTTSSENNACTKSIDKRTGNSFSYINNSTCIVLETYS